MTMDARKLWLWWLLPALPLVLAVSWGVGMALAHVIDDDPDFGPGTVASQQSRAVAMTARLILREVDEHKWVANDPFFNPSAALDDMPAFQTGIVAALARFTDRLAELSPGTGERDIELGRAAGFLKYPGTVWKFDLRSAWMPTASSEKQYRAAARNLLVYNDRLMTGEAQYPRDAATLATLLDSLGADMDAAADRLDAHMAQGHWALFDSQADDLFYDAKGRVYAQSLIVRELGWDFAAVIAAANLGEQWQSLLAALRHAAGLEPLVVLAGSENSSLFANHLANQGFRLLQARARLARLTAALRTDSEH